MLDIYIFSFHMPLFFFISGLLKKEEELQKPFWGFIKKNFYALLVPYLFFGVISYFPWVFITRYFGADASLQISPFKPLIGMLYGIGVEGWLQHNAMLWFFPCLFVAHILFYGLFRLRIRRYQWGGIFLASLLGYVISIFPIPRLPWGIDVALSAMIFYGAGFLLKDWLLRFSPSFLQLFILASFFFIIQCVAISINGRVDMNSHYYGNPLLFYMAGICGIGFWVLICKKVPRWNWLAKIGFETIVIFPLHRVAFSFITGIAIFILHMNANFKNYFITSICYTALAILLLLPVAKFFRAFSPWAVGQKKA